MFNQYKLLNKLYKLSFFEEAEKFDCIKEIKIELRILKDINSVLLEKEELIEMEYYSLKHFDTIFDEETRNLTIKDECSLDVNVMKSLTGLDQDVYAIYFVYVIPYLNIYSFPLSQEFPVYTIRENLTLNLHRE